MFLCIEKIKEMHEKGFYVYHLSAKNECDAMLHYCPKMEIRENNGINDMSCRRFAELLSLSSK